MTIPCRFKHTLRSGCVVLIICALATISAFRIGSSSTSSGTPTAHDENSSSELGRSHVKLCTSFGFRSNAGIKLFSQLFGSTILESDDIIMINASEPDELVELGGGDVSIGFLSKVQMVANEDAFLSYVQAFADGVSNSGLQSTLIVVAEGEKDALLDNLIASVTRIVDDTQALSAQQQQKNVAPLIKVLTYPLGAGVAAEASAVAEIKDKIDSCLAAASSHDRGLSAKKYLQQMTDADSSELVDRASLKEVRLAGEVFDRSSEIFGQELEAAEPCAVLSDDFSLAIRAAIQSALGRSIDNTEDGLLALRLPAGASINGTVQAIRAEMQSAVADHHAKFRGTFDVYGSSNAMKAAAHRARTDLANVLQPVFRAVTESALRVMAEVFDAQLQRVPGSTKLPNVLQDLSSATFKSFSKNLNAFKNEILSIVTMQTEEGILSAEYSSVCDWLPAAVQAGQIRPPKQSRNQPVTVTSFTSASAAHFSKQLKASLLPQFDVSLEERRLKSYVRRKVDERISFLFLSGGYNPYIRDSPLPPTHINFNYYIDPRAIVVNREFGALYDEHKDGPCEDRADPLQIPGVAQFPFDPNQHPVPTEQEDSMWKLVYDFFTKD